MANKLDSIRVNRASEARVFKLIIGATGTWGLLSGMLIVSALVAAFIQPWFFILSGVCLLGSWRSRKQVNKLIRARELLNKETNGVTTADYARSLENERDEFMACLLQKNICPWGNGKLKACQSKACKCLVEQVCLREQGFET